ncbi:M48 family metallopeptidase [Microbispora sp. GKU 823]|uniref:M48 family metallopeptidase n=1 Tax=Microbispora sp. GKU 823 TaxID=1652100 RepID=UPI001C4E0F6C|nr:M48 family metallopeptidase [Microbispora sp. GKU 823]
MANSIRAGISLAMLAGFFVLAAAQVAGLLALALWLSTVLAGLVVVKLLWPLFAASTWAVGRGVWRAVRSRPEPPAGLLMPADQAPMLWAAVRDLAAEAGTRMPDEIWLTAEANAAVQEESRFLGLAGGHRRLYVGLPLLQTMTVAQMRAVLAHELGHYSERHTRLSAPAYRGRLVIAHTLERIGPHNPAGWIFRGYARLYLLVDHAVSRRQELEADLASARAAGADAAAGALREIRVLDAAWSFFLGQYVHLGWESGYAPADLFAGFGALVEARRDELDELRAHEPDDNGSRWDTHPPLSERLAALAAAPHTTASPDTRPAAMLLADIAEAGRALQRVAIDSGERTLLPWPDLTAAALAARVQREADAVFRMIARTVGRPVAGLADVAEYIAAGQLTTIAQPFFPTATRREAGPLFAEPLETLLRLAALRSGVARWWHSWSGPAEFRGVRGTELPLEEIAKLAVTPGGLDKALGELAALGVDIHRAVPADTAPSTFGSDVVGGLANVRADGAEHDLFVLTTGLVLVADPGKSDNGRQRMRELLAATSAVSLAERNRFVAFEEIESVRIHKQVPLDAELVLYGGATLRIGERWSSDELDDGSRKRLVSLLERV